MTETTALLRKPFELISHPAHSGPCDHGTFSPRPGSVRSGYGYGFGSSPPRSQEGESSKSRFGSFLENVGMRNGGKKKMSTTNWLAERHGITNTTTMYVWSLPSLFSFQGGDLIANDYFQVLYILYTVSCLDTAIPMGTSSR